LNLLDKTIEFISPELAYRRKSYRDALAMKSTYDGAWLGRTGTYFSPSESMVGMPHMSMWVQRQLRDRARSLVDNNILAASSLDTAVNNVCGGGFRAQPQTLDADWNKQCEDLLENWYPRMDYYSRSWNDHCRAQAYGVYRDGDIGNLLLKSGQVQTIESDYISSPPEAWRAAYHDGLELDDSGRVKNYYILTWNDPDKPRKWSPPIKPKDMLFIANRRRVHQWRGETAFAQSFKLFDQTSSYLNSVVTAQALAAKLALFVHKKDATTSVMGLRQGQGTNGPKPIKEFKDAMVEYLNPGEDITQIQPNQPGSDFDNNTRMLIRLLGLALSLPLELALFDFSKTSYSSARASMLQAQRGFIAKQTMLEEYYFRPLYRWRVSKWMKDGELPFREDAFNHLWLKPIWPYLDPVKELQGVLLEIDSGISTVTHHIKKRGGDPDKVFAERANELAVFRKLNIPFSHSMMTGVVEDTAPQAQGIVTPQSDMQRANVGLDLYKAMTE
jgi:lambda family phage portal protein